MRRGDVTRRTAAHTAACKCVNCTTGARTTRSAALGRLDDSLAARRSISIGVAGVGPESAEPAVRRGEQDEARGCHSMHGGAHGGAWGDCKDDPMVAGQYISRSTVAGCINDLALVLSIQS